MCQPLVKTWVCHTFDRGNLMSHDPLIHQLNRDPDYFKSLTDFALKRSLDLNEVSLSNPDTYPANTMSHQSENQ